MLYFIWKSIFLILLLVRYIDHAGSLLLIISVMGSDF